VERDHGTLRPDLGRDGFGEGVKSRLAHCARETRLPTTQGQGLGQPPQLVDGFILTGLGLKQVRRQARDDSRCMFAAFHLLAFLL
jgi:hypothetical protein